ncbi:Dentin sialophosphoprotein [Hirschfeldia incana]|nr:Dentin sialophosphoprotein [Hirschfeldia incana]
MGLDAKDVCVIVWKVIRFSTNTTCRYVKRYPVASCVSAFVIFLYTFLPRIFYFILYSSPLVACASFYLRNHLSSKIGEEEEEEKRRDRGLSSVSSEGGRTEKAELKHQRSVRRNARREVEEVGKDWDSSQASEDERGKVILTTLYGELPPETITPDLETFKRDRTLLAAEESFVESNLDNEDYVVVEDPLERVCDGETELECSSSSSSSEEEEEEEEEEKETNKDIVVWTEDDQKNLMDLGTSEIERNKRLENLITRRRSRRLFLLAAERSLMDMEVPRICIGRNYYGLDRDNYEADGVLMPGSAPSVMLPRRNPFDLPYDPQEERPNLTGDSFQQEFADANPRDIFLCRHESFHHRVFPSESQNDSKLESLWRKTADGRPRPLQGSNEQLPIMKESDVEAGEVRIETDSIRNNDESDSNMTLSPREREKDFSVSDLSDASETFCKRNEDRVGKSFPGLVPRSGGSSSLAKARQRYMEHFGYSIKRSHVSTHSVDSDMQVEVSELGSHPSSVDGNDSSDEERSLFGYESEISKEMGFNDEEIGMLPVGKIEQHSNEKRSLASPEVEEAGNLKPMDMKKVPGNSADEIKMSYDSDEPEPSERTNQEPCERNDQEAIQQLPEAQTSDVNDLGNSEDSAISPTSVLQDMLPLSHTHSEDLDHTSDGLLLNVDPPPAESSSNQLDEHSDPTEETTVETVCLDATETVQERPEGSEELLINDEPKSAEDRRSLSTDPSAEVLNSHNN